MEKKSFNCGFMDVSDTLFANSKEPHQTGFAYRVAHIVDAAIPGGKAMEVTFKPWEDIPADRVLLEDRPMTAGITN